MISKHPSHQYCRDAILSNSTARCPPKQGATKQLQGNLSYPSSYLLAINIPVKGVVDGCQPTLASTFSGAALAWAVRLNCLASSTTLVPKLLLGFVLPLKYWVAG